MALETVVPLVIAFCPEFCWHVDEFVVHDDSWVDLSNHLDTVESCLGYFDHKCLHRKGKGVVFKTHQWANYEDFIMKRDGGAPLCFTATQKSKTCTTTMTQCHAAPLCDPKGNSCDTPPELAVLPLSINSPAAPSKSVVHGAHTLPVISSQRLCLGNEGSEGEEQTPDSVVKVQ